MFSYTIGEWHRLSLSRPATRSRTRLLLQRRSQEKSRFIAICVYRSRSKAREEAQARQCPPRVLPDSTPRRPEPRCARSRPLDRPSYAASTHRLSRLTTARGSVSRRIPSGRDGITAARSARSADRKAGRCVFLPVRYADDFILLVAGTKEDALAEKFALADYLRETTGLELSPEKTKVTALTDGFEFLGFRFGAHWNKCYGFGTRVEVPKAKAADLRYRVKQLTGRNTTLVSLGDKLKEINPILRGWANYYRYSAYAGDVFTSLDWYIGDRIWRWLRYKRPKASAHEILASRRPSQIRRTRKVWQDGSTEQFLLSLTSVCRYRLAWMGKPNFTMSSGEPDAKRKSQVRFGKRQ